MSEEILKKILVELEALKLGIAQIRDRILVREEVQTIKTENIPIKKPNAPKIERGKVYSIAKDPCRECGGLISWDDRPQRSYPMHVDDKGHIVGDGDCPMFPGGDR